MEKEEEVANEITIETIGKSSIIEEMKNLIETRGTMNLVITGGRTSMEREDMEGRKREALKTRSFEICLQG